MASRVNRVRIFEKDPVLYDDGWDRIWGKKTAKVHDARGIIKAEVAPTVERLTCNQDSDSSNLSFSSNTLDNQGE